MDLRDYQRAAVNAVYFYLKEQAGKNPCVVIPTGGGKTPIIATLCRDCARWGKRVAVLSHVKELLEQSRNTLMRVDPTLDIGIFSAGLNLKETRHQITVAGIQSVFRHAGDFEPFDLIIIDEAHLIPPDGEGMYQTFLQECRERNPNVRLVGMTATPFRTGSGMICSPDGLLNDICYTAEVGDLIQAGSQFSEQKPEKFNPMLTWLLSKGGSPYGGQSIGAMAKYGNQTGNFLASDIGDYDPGKATTGRSEAANENAKKHQISFCIYEGNDPAEAILEACRKGFTVFLGNSVGVASGRVTDENGVEAVKLSGSWSHAQAGGGFQIVNGVRYLYWMNSHGPIYPAKDGTPPIGGWMSEHTLRRFLSGSFADVCFIIYAECPYDLDLKPTLNPEA